MSSRPSFGWWWWCQVRCAVPDSSRSGRLESATLTGPPTRLSPATLLSTPITAQASVSSSSLRGLANVADPGRLLRGFFALMLGRQRGHGGSDGTRLARGGGGGGRALLLLLLMITTLAVSPATTQTTTTAPVGTASLPGSSTDYYSSTDNYDSDLNTTEDSADYDYSTPDGVTLSLERDELTVSWEASSLAGEDTMYRVCIKCFRQRSCCGYCRRYDPVDTNETSTQFTVEPDTTYSVWLTNTSNSCDVDNYADATNQTTPAEGYQSPNLPARITFDDYHGQLNPVLRWEYGCPYTGAVEYKLRVNGTELSPETDDTCSYQVEVPGGDPSTWYNYTLLAQNPGCGEEVPQECDAAADEPSDTAPLPDNSSCSVCTSGRIITPPDYRSIPRDLYARQPLLNASDRSSRISFVDWSDPLHTGELGELVLKYHRRGEDSVECTIPGDRGGSLCDCNQRGCNIEVKPESKYLFELYTRNKSLGQRSESATYTLHTGFGKPYFNGTPASDYKGGTDAPYSVHRIDIDRNKFSNENGHIKRMQIYLAKEQDRLSPATLVYDTDNYESKSYFIFGNGKPVEHCTGNVCNPPLEPDTKYIYTLRISTKERPSDNTDSTYSTDFQGDFKTKSVPIKSVLVFFLVVLTLLLLVVIVVGYVYFRRYFPSMKRSESMMIPLVMTPPADVNVERRIPLSQLTSTIRDLLSQGQVAVRREYAELKSVSPTKPSDYASLPLNKPKNRYINILPFDESRVALKEYTRIPCSDYINASYIHGYTKPKAFIACQGPTDESIEDFWRMVWEKNVHVVVMVTQCVEKNTRKCHKYWPDQSDKKGLTLKQAMLKVTTLQESKHEQGGYITRTFKLSRIPNYRSRIVQHFHFVTWPDMGCPDTPDDLIKLVEAVRSANPSSSSHIVVHCSAGVGRTGTFIGLNNLIDEMANQDSVDVFHAVFKMRMHRANMVQTEAQYTFLYKCVLKYYMNQTGETEADFMEEMSHPKDIPDVITNTPEAKGSSPETETDETASTAPKFSDDEYIEDKDLEPFTDDEEDLIQKSPETEEKCTEQ